MIRDGTEHSDFVKTDNEKCLGITFADLDE